jgi:hypothetical protein
MSLLPENLAFRKRRKIVFIFSKVALTVQEVKHRFPTAKARVQSQGS